MNFDLFQPKIWFLRFCYIYTLLQEWKISCLHDKFYLLSKLHIQSYVGIFLLVLVQWTYYFQLVRVKLHQLNLQLIIPRENK